ncbi:phospho-N-acetylmuramoyl-pentapeptide-transferase [bacterium]|nr:phospho-N-acetylmuramoyl-pentapeptide-transferase [bacterium]
MQISTNFLTDNFSLIFILSVAAFLLSMFLTPIYTYFAYKYEFWKKQRTTSTTGEKLTVFNKLHAEKFKRNIPTMAGIIFVLSIVLVTIIFNLDRGQTYLPVASMIGGAIVGLIDDIVNLKGFGGGTAGLRTRTKSIAVALIGIALGWYFFAKLGFNSIHVPFVGNITLGWLIIPIFAFIVMATANAVNITDGLDGLAGGLSALAFGAFGTIAIFQQQYLLGGFCFVVVGSLLSYIWFNIYPARFFMGDVGSFALGTSLGVVAMMTNSFLLLPVIGFLFMIEAGSSFIQILSKKIFKKKIFISAPLHHHLEATGWPETKITMRFWVIGYVMAILGVLIAITGGHV